MRLKRMQFGEMGDSMTKPVRESQYFLAWLAFFASASLVGFVLGAVVGGVAGFLLASQGMDMQAIRLVAGVGGFLISLPISYGSFRLFVDRLIVRRVVSQTPPPVQQTVMPAPAVGMAWAQVPLARPLTEPALQPDQSPGAASSGSGV